MSVIKRTRRRSFLKLGLAGIATGAIAPTLWIPRLGRASMDVPADKNNHLIIFNLDGGARSVRMFNADKTGMWSPDGVHPGAPGTEWGVGGIFQADPYPGGVLGVDVPSLPQISNQVCVLGTIDHTPGEATSIGDHNTAMARMASGFNEGGPGLLSLVHGYSKKYTEAAPTPVFPPVIVGPGASTQLFGVPKGPALAPVIIPSFEEFTEQSGENAGGQPSWARALEQGLDQHTSTIRSARDRDLIDRLRNGKMAVEAFRDVFLDPILDITGQPNAALHGLTNAELIAALGPDVISLNTALALRFIGFGSAAVVIGDTGWDTHSGEAPAFTNSARRLARVFAGLQVALKMLQHPEGGTYWDRTLIMVTSEFGRDNLEGNGYNSGGGSDHTGGPGSRFQAFPFFGGLVGQPGKLIGRTDASTMEALEDEPVFSTRSLLAMCLALLDVDYSPHIPDEPLTAVFA